MSDPTGNALKAAGWQNKYTTQWREWLAWYPVQVENRRIAWLRTVEWAKFPIIAINGDTHVICYRSKRP